MTQEIYDQIRELCEQIVVEQDSRKFLELITHLDELLTEKKASSAA